MRWVFLLFALSACDRVFQLDDIRSDATAIPIDARAGYAGVVLADGAAAYWRLGAASGLAAIDETGNGNVGTLLGGLVPGVDGPLVADDDGAFAFDGVDDAITMGDRLEFAGVAAFTVEAWVRPSAHANYLGVVSKSDEDSGGVNKIGYILYDQYQVFGFDRISDTDTQYVRTTSALPLDQWAYAAVTFDGATLALHIDGALQTTDPNTVPLPATTKPFTIGARNGGEFLYYAGSIDEVAVYDHALEATQIENHRRVALAQ